MTLTPTRLGGPMPHPNLVAYIRDHVVERGDFTLSSGARSTYYIDGKRATLTPRGMNLIAAAVHEEIAKLAPVDAVGGLEMGATPIVAAVAALSPEGRPVDGLIVRKATKGHGFQCKTKPFWIPATSTHWVRTSSVPDVH